MEKWIKITHSLDDDNSFDSENWDSSEAEEYECPHCGYRGYDKYEECPGCGREMDTDDVRAVYDESDDDYYDYDDEEFTDEDEEW